MKKIKPEVIGYQQVGYQGYPWDKGLWSPVMSLLEMTEESKIDLINTRIKSKFRPVYKKDIS